MKRALLAATAILFSSVVSITPAQAVPGIGPPATDGLTMQQVCDLQLRPNDPADFSTWPKNIGTPTLISSTTVRDATHFDQTPVGDPTYSGFSGHRNPFRNGGSPNVWAQADANSAHYASSLLHYHTTITDTFATTFDCEVQKTVGNGNLVDPRGLESSNNSVLSTQTRAGPDVTEVGGPMTIAGSFIAQILICISPNNTTKGKPGDWRGMHEFPTANCPQASLDAQDWVPSENAPDY